LPLMKQTLNVCNLLLLAVNVKMADYGSEFNRSTLKIKKTLRQLSGSFTL
jgi:hypothetical protein